MKTYLIQIEGMQDYRLDSNGDLWRLPFTTVDGKKRGLKLMRKEALKKRWTITLDGVQTKISENQILPCLVLDSENLLNIQSNPFK